VILVLAAAATPGSAQVAKIRISGSGIETVELTAADLTKSLDWPWMLGSLTPERCRTMKE
jgi:hypothetical protein